MSDQIKPSRTTKRVDDDINLADLGLLPESADSDWEDEFEAGVEKDDLYSLEEDMDSFMRENDLIA